MITISSYLLRFRFGLAGMVSALAHKSIICFVLSVTMALPWRLDSAVAAHGPNQWLHWHR